MMMTRYYEEEDKSMRFDEVFQDFLDGKRIACGDRTFDILNDAELPTRLLGENTWNVYSRMDEYMEELKWIPCIDFREYEAWDMMELNIIKRLEECATKEEIKDTNTHYIQWEIPNDISLNMVENNEFTDNAWCNIAKLRLNDNGFTLYGKGGMTYACDIQLKNIDLFYLKEKKNKEQEEDE